MLVLLHLLNRIEICKYARFSHLCANTLCLLPLHLLHFIQVNTLEFLPRFSPKEILIKHPLTVDMSHLGPSQALKDSVFRYKVVNPYLIRVEPVVAHRIGTCPEQPPKLATKDVVGVAHAVYRHDYQCIVPKRADLDILHDPCQHQYKSEAGVYDYFYPEPDRVL